MQNMLNGFKYLMAIFYMAIGIWVLIHPNSFGSFNLDPMFGRLIGVILIAYGCFRAYRAYTSSANQHKE